MNRYLLMKILIPAVSIPLLLIFVIGLIPQHGNQMYPAVRDGDLMITIKAGAAYRAGDVCGYRDQKGRLRLGRIAAGPGDEVSFSREGELLINGLSAAEERFYPAAAGEVPLPYTVPEDSFFILNDHRSETDDSRHFGAVKRSLLRGRAFWLFRRRGF